MNNLRSLTGLSKGGYALFIVSAVLFLVGLVVLALVIFGPSTPAPEGELLPFPNGQMSALPAWLVWSGLASLVGGALLLMLTFTRNRRASKGGSR